MRWFTLKGGLLWGHHILKVYTSLFYPKWDDLSESERIWLRPAACDNAGLVSSLTLGVVWGHWAPGSCSHWPTEPEAGAGAREEWAGLALGRGQAEAANASGPPRPRPAGRARLGSSSYEPEWLWRWLLGFKGGQRRREESPTRHTSGHSGPGWPRPTQPNAHHIICNTTKNFLQYLPASGN